jgi:GntR family transcriptional regulator, transcriptional repressor for pyruvate dehydrogenase complex
MKMLEQPRTPKRSRSLALDLVIALEGRIKDGSYPLGTRMPTEADIMNQHGVSRTVVREAISRLQQAGLVITQHGIGSFVSPQLPDDQGFRISTTDIATIVDIVHVLELRISLETECAGLSAQRRNERQLASMKAALDEFDACAEAGSETVDADFKFHLAVAEATQNPHFFDLMRHLGTNVIPRARVNSPQIAMEDKRVYLERVNREHRSIYEAIERGDSDSARAAMRLHLTNSRERLRRAAGEESAVVRNRA